MTQHATKGASSAARWMNCPGSIRMTEALPEKDRSYSSTYANEGSVAHALAEKCLLANKPAEHYLGWVGYSPDGTGRNWIVGDVAPAESEQYPVTLEMTQAVQVYLDRVKHHIDRLPGRTVEIEKRVKPLEDRDDMWGTTDLVVVQPFGELVVSDYKHGKGHAVEVEHNPQAMYYALGALREAGGPDEFDKVTIEIVQPRARHEDGPVRSWPIDPRQLWEWGDTLRAAAEATEDPDAPLAAGDWCTFCPVGRAGRCPEVDRKAKSQVREDWEDVIETGVSLADDPGSHVRLPDPSNAEELAKALELVPVLDFWVKTVVHAAQHGAESGMKIPGHKLVRKKSNRRWQDEEAVVAKLKAKRGVKAEDYLVDPKLRSPAQLEKIKGIGKDFVAEHAVKPKGGLVLAPSSDPREEVAPPILTDFADLIE